MIAQRIEEIAKTVKEKKLRLIGVCGIPGAGKSTLAQSLKNALGKAIVIPMDGFHLYRKDLDQDGLKYRGAPRTFDLLKFRDKIREVKARLKFPVMFPSFDHALKDPIENDISLEEDIEHVIVEGIYVFDKSLQLENCWDLKIWIQSDLNNSLERLVKRNFQAGISPSLEACRLRTFDSDHKNALHVLNNSNRENCIIIDNNF